KQKSERQEARDNVNNYWKDSNNEKREDKNEKARPLAIESTKNELGNLKKELGNSGGAGHFWKNDRDFCPGLGNLTCQTTCRQTCNMFDRQSAYFVG
ncbi:unnamed protein product, partial [Oikopleura dioica]